MPSTYACMAPGLRLVGRCLAPTRCAAPLPTPGGSPTQRPSHRHRYAKTTLSSSDGCRSSAADPDGSIPPESRTEAALAVASYDDGCCGCWSCLHRWTAQTWRSCSDATRVVRVTPTMATSRRPRSLQRTAPMRAAWPIRMRACRQVRSPSRSHHPSHSLCIRAWCATARHLCLQPWPPQSLCHCHGTLQAGQHSGAQPKIGRPRASHPRASRSHSSTPCAPTNWRRARRN